MAETTVFEVPVHGKVELRGTGPWKVMEIGRGSYEIVDSEGRGARLTMWQKTGVDTFKSNQNVVFANKSTPNAIVNHCNQELAKINAV